MATIYRGRVGARMAPPRGPRTAQSRHAGREDQKLVNGPWRGFSLRLAPPCCTLPLTVGNLTGRYVGGAWSAA